MKFAACRPFDELFQHDDAGTFRCFNATRLYEYAVQHALPITNGWLDPEQTEFIRKHRGVEQWKLDRLREPFLSRPILLLHMGDDSHLTVDGHHRWVRLADMGRDSIEAYVFEVAQWEPFLVEDYPCSKSSPSSAAPASTDPTRRSI